MSTYQTQLTARLETARQERKLATENAKLSLLNNENFIATKLNSVLKSEELLHLNTLITQVSAISPFIAKDGTKYGVKVFPIAIFGLGFGQLIGLIKGSDNAFTDEMLAEYSAITGIESVELREASHYLGSVAYCNKAGIVVDAEPCNWSKFQQLMHSIAMSLGLDAFNVADITQDRIDLWFAKEAIKAHKQCADIGEAQALDTATDAFTLED
jgi:hypothetical protein